MVIDAARGFSCTLKMRYVGDGRIKVWLAWDSGWTHGQWDGLYLSTEEWDKLVAWVEWQRKEEMAEKAKELAKKREE